MARVLARAGVHALASLRSSSDALVADVTTYQLGAGICQALLGGAVPWRSAGSAAAAVSASGGSALASAGCARQFASRVSC